MARSVAFPDLRDDVIALRLPADRDVDAITAACQDPDIPRFTRIRSPYTRGDAELFVAGATESWRTGEHALPLAICDRQTDTLLGSVGVHLREQPEVAEIGYWIARDARRRGIATRAVRLVSRWAIPTLGLQRLELMTRTDNVASQGVAERAGFTREGLLRSYITLGCGLRDVCMFSLLPTDLDGEVTT
jgi:RimJ/RimL family protein N-acetyltransferase